MKVVFCPAKSFNLRVLLWGALMAGAVLSGICHAKWPVVPLPPQSKGEMVTQHMRNNGLDMQASVFVTSEPLDSVLIFYRRQWGKRMVEDQVGNKTILGHDTGSHFISIELTTNTGLTHGTIGILKAPDPGFSFTPGEGVLLPSGSEVLSDVRFLDTKEQPRFVTVINRHTPFVNQQFYYQRLTPRGWRIDNLGRCAASSQECMTVFEHATDGRITLFSRRTRLDPEQDPVTQVIMQMQ